MTSRGARLYSPTVLDRYACPRWGLYAHERQEKHGKTRGTGPAATGQDAHSEIAAYLRYRLKMPEAFTGPACDEALDIVKNWTESDHFPERIITKNAGDLVLIEEELTKGFLTGTPDHARICGDHGEGPVYVDDWKTNREPFTRAEAEASDQLKFYALLVWLLYPETEAADFILTYHFIRCPGCVRSFTMTHEDVSRFGERLIPRVKRIMAMTEHPEAPGPACKWCEIAHLCDSVGPPPIGSEADPEIVYHRMRACERGASLAKDILKEHVRDNGPVRIGDKILDFHQTSERYYPPEYLHAVLEGWGITDEQIMSVMKAPVGKVDDLVKKNSGARKALEQIMERKAGVEFGLRKE